MPALNVIENNDRIIEINHHLVHLNTHHYNDWINPRDLLNNFLYHHSSPAGSGGHYPGSPTQAGHHSFSHINDTHLGNTTPGLPPHPGHGGVVGDDTEEESLIVVYALFLPLLAALIFILIVALYVRRMRRSNSMQNVTHQNEAYEFSLEQLKSHNSTAHPHYPTNNNKSSSAKIKDSSLTNLRTENNTNKMRNNNKANLTRSKSSSAFPHQTADANGSTKQQYYSNTSLEPYQKRWNNTGFLSSSSTNESFEEDEDVSDKSGEIIPYNNGPLHMDEVHITITSDTEDSPQGRKSLKKLISVLNVPKRIKQNSIEKKRFNIYTIPIETREQLKQIYVY